MNYNIVKLVISFGKKNYCHLKKSINFTLVLYHFKC